MRRLPLNLIVGGGITLIFCIFAIVSRFWTPVDPTEMNILLRLKGPGDGGLLGTDSLGRDVASQLMAGAWTSLGISFVAVAIGGGIGIAIGVTAAAQRGFFEKSSMRVCDVVFAFPPILSAILLGALLGAGAFTSIVAIAVFMIPVFARVARGAALQIWKREYVLAARMSGKDSLRITLEHIIPNISPQIIVQFAIQTGLGILTEAGLSFVGLGISPPTPSWGRMLADAKTYMSGAPYLVLAPGLAVAVAVLGLNLLGDGLSAISNPRRGGKE